ncbi:MAG: glutamate racemase [Myxococcales bacterium]|nr:glutamate racemase [Myxococcales bacterium]
MRTDAPIGVFDSGLGGLTVARAIRDRLPGEDIVYLGDTARVPYGTRSASTVIRYARACASHLQKRDIKLLVVACNTVSAVALDMLRVELDIPVLGVIEPGARAGVAACRSGRLGVIATAGTVASGAYTRAVAAEGTRVEVVARATPLLVPLVEEGWLTGEVPRLVLRRYLDPLIASGIRSLVLGCTHFPLLRPEIESVLGELSEEPIPVVDSAMATAEELAGLLSARRSSTPRTDAGSFELLVTDRPHPFEAVASRFLAGDLDRVSVTQVDL